MVAEFLDIFTRSFIFYFVVIDPLGTVAIFLSLLQRINNNKNKIAVEATFFSIYNFSILFHNGKSYFKSPKYIIIFI